MDTAPLPPGPRWPSVVQSARWFLGTGDFLESCAKRYGDTFTVHLAGFPPFVVTSDPEAVRTIFTGDPDQLHAGRANAILKPILGEHSLLLIDGPKHRTQRKLMMPPFHGERMQAYGATMRRIADEAIDRWPIGRAFPIHKEMQRITLDVILRTVFGLSPGAEEDRLRKLLTRLLDFGDRPAMLLFIDGQGQVRFGWLHERLGRFSPWMRARALLDQIDKVLFAEFARRRAAGGGGEDVLSLLLAARDEQGQAMTDAELRDEMLTLLIAGHETTATSLTWVIHRLLGHPSVLARLRAEIAQNGGEAYLDAVIKETMRLDPIIAMVGRFLQQPMSIGARTLPAGVAVAPSIYLAHRRPDLWPEPMAWRPERFLDKRPSPYEFFPFGGGTRRCIGMAFALYEMRVVLPRVLARTRLREKPGYKPRVVRRGVTMALSEGLPVVRDA